MTETPESPIQALSDRIGDALAERLGIDLSRYYRVGVDDETEEALDRIAAAEKIPAALRDRIKLV
jgi:hypothetical protein